MNNLLLQLALCVVLFGAWFAVSAFQRPKECDHRPPVHECGRCSEIVGWPVR